VTSAQPLHQLTLDDLGTPLIDVTFCVVDLETTGSKPQEAGITEIGAVKVRGGEILGEFATLVNPGQPVPAFIAALTGITNSMVVDAPSVAAATWSFWEFAKGCVIVAHNAPYDIGFLKGAAALAQQPWPTPAVVDTAVLARRVLGKDEVPNCKLATLATFFRSPATPVHRALDDARATVHVLHGLLDRMGPSGVHSLEDLLAFTGRTSEVQRRKRTLADGLPKAPGVYVFVDGQGHSLYVGTSTNIRARVRNYFTASEPRTRMRQMLHLAASVQPIVCATPLEAQVRELRLIAEQAPPFNRRSRYPHRQQWIALSAGRTPRLTVTGRLGATHQAAIGPFHNRARAHEAALALCAPLGSTWEVDPKAPLSTEQAHIIATVMSGDTREMISAVDTIMGHHSDAGRFEQAGAWRDRLASALLAVARAHSLKALRQAGRIIAVAPHDDLAHLHIIDHGHLVSATVLPAGSFDPDTLSLHLPAIETVTALSATAEIVEAPADGPGILPAGLTEESRLLWRWLSQEGVRILATETALTLPRWSGGNLLQQLGLARAQADSALGGLLRQHNPLHQAGPRSPRRDRRLRAG
jgi:DNA polymerase-3 subunit epsilon